MGTALLPEIDEGVINGDIEMPVGTRLDITYKAARQTEGTILRDVPEHRRMFFRSGSHWRRGGRRGSRSTSRGMILSRERLLLRRLYIG
ncbi:MAG: hypothetical protein JRJ70_08680 [Deltaproteobacteria bacterium]|nr:hypothetical protein [Deltaproteobacteria bacterium]